MKISKRVLSVILTVVMIMSAVNFSAFAIDIDNGTPVESTQVMTDDGEGRLVIPNATVTASPVIRVADASNPLTFGQTIVKATPSGIPLISSTYDKEAYAGETPVWPTVVFNSDLSLAGTVSSVSLTSNIRLNYTSQNNNNTWTFTITGGDSVSAGSYIDYVVKFKYTYTDRLTGKSVTKDYEAYGSSYVENIAQPAGMGIHILRKAPGTFHSAEEFDGVYRILGVNTYGGYYGGTGDDYAEGWAERKTRYSHGYYDFRCPNGTTLENAGTWGKSGASMPGYGLVLHCNGSSDGNQFANGSLGWQRPVSTTYIDSSKGTALNSSSINLRYAFFDAKTTWKEGDYTRKICNDTVVLPGVVEWGDGSNNSTTAANQLGFALMGQELVFNNKGTYNTSSPYAITNRVSPSKVWGLSIPFNGTTYKDAMENATEDAKTKFISYTLGTTQEGVYSKSGRLVSPHSAVSLKFYMYNKADLRGTISEALSQNVPVSPTGPEIGITPQSWYYSSGWDAFKTALKNAQHIEARPDVLQKDIDAAAAALVTAETNLVVAKADYTTANNYLQELANEDSSLRTAESWAAVVAAREPLDAENQNYTVFYQSKVDSLTAKLAAAIANLKYRPADFEKVDNSIAYAESLDLTKYTDDSVAFLQSLITTARSENFRNRDIRDQEYIDKFADQIDEAVDALVEKPADYTEVQKAVDRYNEVKSDKDDYTTNSWARVQSAYDSITYGLGISLQSYVDDMANDLNNAIDNLQFKPADYDALNALVDEVYELDSSLYTQASWNNLMNAVNAVDYDLNIKQQGQVNNYIAAIRSARAALEYVVGDYTAVTNAITAANRLNEAWYTTASWSNLQSAINNVRYGLTVDKQAQIDAFATAINDAISALVLLPADYSAVNAQKARYEALNTSLYTPASLLVARQAYNSIVEGKTIDKQSEVDAMAKTLKDALDNLQYKAGNYTNVNAAVASANALIEAAEAYATKYAGHSYYTTSSYNALKSAVNAVVYNLTIDKQSQIDGYANAINNAIAALQLNGAYYAAVDSAVASVPSDLDSGRYTPASVAAVKAALNAVDRNLKTDEQDTVDAYAAAINEAVTKLGINTADYSSVEYAKGEVPSDLSIYTSASVAKLNAAINAVVYNLSIDEQERVEGFAAAILEAIGELELDLADYTAVNEAKTRAAAALADAEAQYYTQASKDAVTAAVNAVVEGLPSSQQARVTGFATAINSAVNGLAYKPIDDAEFKSIKTQFEARTDLANYTDASVKAVRDEIAKGDVLLQASDTNIKKQSQLDSIVTALKAAIANLKEKDADYTAVNVAINKANLLDRDLYTNFSIVTDAINAVVPDLKITEQARVDGFAEAIEDAIAALQFKPINTEEYVAAQATVPADLDLRTDATVAAMNEAKAAIDEFLAGDVNISHQSQLDSLVETYKAKIAALAYKPGNYDALTAVINEFKALNEDDYTNYYDAYSVYRSVNNWKTANPNLDITKQDQIDAQTQLLRDAIDSLIPVPVVTARFDVKGTAYIDGKYICGLKTKLTAGNLNNTFLDYEGVEVTLTKAIEDARYYGTGSTVTVKYPDGTTEVYTIIIFGDIDGNSIIDTDDAFATLEAANDNSLFTAVQKKAANVDGVRRISLDDYAIINDAALGLVDIDQTSIG